MANKKNETVMIFCAHPDDEILGVGGTIARYSSEGKEVITVIFSYGEGSHPWMKKKLTVQTRVKESKKAGEIVGCKKTLFLAVGDTKITDEVKNPAVEKRIANLIKKYKPSKIFTHNIDDVIYKDHKAVHDIMVKVIDDIKFKGDVYSFNIWNPFNIRKRGKPRLIVDITDTFKTKLKALNCFKSQKVALVQLLPVVYIRAFKHGMEGESKYAEKFYKLK